MADSSLEQVHHIPSNSPSYLTRQDRSAIIMDMIDHRLTASFDDKCGSRAYRLMQKNISILDNLWKQKNIINI